MRPLHRFSAPARLRSRSARWAAAAVATAALAGPALDAPALAADGLLDGCSAQPLSQPFLPFLDAGWYTPVANAGFEAAGQGWTLTGGAAVVAENEPWQGGSPTVGPALRLAAC